MALADGSIHVAAHHGEHDVVVEPGAGRGHGAEDVRREGARGVVRLLADEVGGDDELEAVVAREGLAVPVALGAGVDEQRDEGEVLVGGLLGAGGLVHGLELLLRVGGWGLWILWHLESAGCWVLVAAACRRSWG